MPDSVDAASQLMK